MRTLMACVGSGLRAAMAAGVLWWMINASHTVNGAGRLERQGWPLSSLGLCVAVGALAGGTWGLLNESWRRAHERDVADVCRRMGLAYTPSAEGVREDYPGLARMPLFKGWSSGMDRMTGLRDGQPVEVFDYTRAERGEQGERYKKRTVVLLPGVALPDFELRPRTLGFRLLGLAGLEGV